MKNKIFLSFIAALFLMLSTNAQSYDSEIRFRKYSLATGVSASTLPGVSIELASSITNRINLRAGFVFIPVNKPFSYEHAVNFQDPELKSYIETKNAKPMIIASAKFASFSGRILFDFTPVRDGMFHLTTGLVLGESSIKLDGALVNTATGRNLLTEMKEDGINREAAYVEKDGFKLNFSEEGAATAAFRTGKILKPYFGLGLGRAIPRNRIGFKAELGFLHTGGLKLSSPNVLDENNKSFDNKDITPIVGKFIPELEKYKDMLQWSLLINLQLQVRLN